MAKIANHDTHLARCTAPLDRWPSDPLLHLGVLVVYAVAAFWVALALTRKRFAG